jgi:creatinine amidohydrolase
MVEMTWPELAAAIKNRAMVLVALGSTEQHGPHLPLGTDAMQAAELMRRIVARLSDDTVAVVGGPVIPFGMSPDQAEIAMPFPGCINLQSSTLLALTKDVCRSLYQHGFRKIILLQTHGENDAIAQVAAKDLVEELEHLDLVYINFSPYMSQASTEFGPHAGLAEASRMLATHPELVQLSRLEGPGSDAKASAGQGRLAFNFSPSLGGGVSRPIRNSAPLAALGYYGDPRDATREKGETGWEAVVAWICDVIRSGLKPE